MWVGDLDIEAQETSSSQANQLNLTALAFGLVVPIIDPSLHLRNLPLGRSQAGVVPQKASGDTQDSVEPTANGPGSEGLL